MDVLELVSSQPTPGTDRVRYFPQLAKRALKLEIMRNIETINRKVMFQPIFAYLNFFRTIDRLGIGGKKIYGDPWQFFEKMYNPDRCVAHKK